MLVGAAARANRGNGIKAGLRGVQVAQQQGLQWDRVDRNQSDALGNEPCHGRATHFRTNRIGTVRMMDSPLVSGVGRGGNGCARCSKANASSSRSGTPDERTMRLLITCPCRSMVKDICAMPWSWRAWAAAG